MNKKLETSLYSIGGVTAMLLIAVAVNVIVSKVRVRADLTADRLYTLSEGTKTILKKLDTPVKVRLYVLPGESPEALILKNYAQRVEDLLAEFQQVAGKNLVVEKLTPAPDSDAEDSANLDGVEGQMDRTGEKIYLGVSFSCVDQKQAIPFLGPDRERLLEYDLISKIAAVSTPEKPVIGVMSSLPVFGQPMNPMMMQMGQRGSAPWLFINELKQQFDVKQLETSAEKIEDNIKVLVLVHPKNLSDATQYAIDQFVMRGGKLVAFIDPFSTEDRAGGNPMMGGMGGQGGPSSLGKLTDAWGVQFDSAKVVADMNFRSRIIRGGRPETAPAVLSLNRLAVNPEDVVTEQVDNLLVWYVGSFSGTPADGLKQTVLIKSTTDSQLVDAFTAQMSGEQVARDFKASGKEFPIAIRLEGKFKSAFPNGKPAAPEPPAAEGEKKDEAKKDAPKADTLKESKGETAVVLVGDTDILVDRYAAEIQDFFGQQIMIPRNANLTFVQGVIEQMAGDSNLIRVRSRATMNRPFTLVREMEAQAESRYREEIGALEKSLQETQARLSELQVNKDKNQRFILSPEQQKEIENFRKVEADGKKKLKEVRKNLRQDIESLQNRLKWINILAMPVIVAFSGIALAVIKRKRTAAK